LIFLVSARERSFVLLAATMKEPQEKRPKSWRREREEWRSKPDDQLNASAAAVRSSSGDGSLPDEHSDAASVKDDVGSQSTVSESVDQDGCDEEKQREGAERMEQEEKVTFPGHIIRFSFHAE
jgi:hypothetical protein